MIVALSICVKEHLTNQDWGWELNPTFSGDVTRTNPFFQIHLVIGSFLIAQILSKASDIAAVGLFLG